MRGEAVETEGREAPRRSRYRTLLGLVPLALLIAAIAPSPAAADPQFQDGCRVQLTGEEGSNEATFTFRCAEFGVSEVNVQANKNFTFFPIVLQGDQGGGFLCTPDAPDEQTCEGEAAEDENIEGTVLSQDACGTEDNEPLVFDVTLAPDPTNGNVEFTELQIQCVEPPPDGNGDGDGNGGGGGEDDGATPQGGVDSGAGGAADGASGDMSEALLPAGLGLLLVGTLGLGALALVRRRT